jgi:hypothetical protein
MHQHVINGRNRLPHAILYLMRDFVTVLQILPHVKLWRDCNLTGDCPFFLAIFQMARNRRVPWPAPVKRLSHNCCNNHLGAASKSRFNLPMMRLMPLNLFCGVKRIAFSGRTG